LAPKPIKPGAKPKKKKKKDTYGKDVEGGVRIRKVRREKEISVDDERDEY